MKKCLGIAFFVGVCVYILSKWEFQITVRKRECKPTDQASETETVEEGVKPL